VRRGAVRLPPGLRLARCCWGALRGCNGILMDRTVLVAEEQWRPGALQMPLHVVRQHAQQDVCSHPVIQPVVDRANMQVNCLEASPCPFDLGKALLRTDHIVGGHLLLIHRRADHIQGDVPSSAASAAISVSLLVTTRLSSVMTNSKCFGHLVLVTHSSHTQANLGPARRFLRKQLAGRHEVAHVVSHGRHG
jgi:hypothetical protein